MSKTFKRLLTAGLLSLAAQVSALNLLPDAPQQYVVVKGDTLWDISARFTNNPWEWPEIWYQNEQIDNPHLIFPGDVIGLITIDGETRVGIVSRGNASRTVKMSPGTVKMQPAVRIEPIEAAIPAIPLSAIRSFLRDHRVVDPVELDEAPRVLSGDDDHLVMGAGSKMYVRGNLDEATEAYGIFRRGQVYIDEDSEEILGLEALDIGLARVIATPPEDSDVYTLLLEQTNQQVAIGDRLLPTADRKLVTRFYPKAPERDVNGKILAVSGGVTQVGQYDVVVLNRGERDWLQPGDVLVVKKQGSVVYDRVAGERVRLPSEKAGEMMIFRTFEKLSYALVMKATRPLAVGDFFESP